MWHRHLDEDLPRRPVLRRRSARGLVALTLVALALTSCGGHDSAQLVDGSEAARLPAELEFLDSAVMTRTEVKRESDLDQDEYRACGVPADAGDRTVVERTGLSGSSLTIASGTSLYGCDKILDPATAEDPDLPLGGIWCGSANGRLESGELNDPRLSICPSTDDDLTAFAWVPALSGARWVVIADGGTREVYEVVESLPVRVTARDGVQTIGTASFAIEEYAAEGTKLREYTLEAQVAG